MATPNTRGGLPVAADDGLDSSVQIRILRDTATTAHTGSDPSPVEGLSGLLLRVLVLAGEEGMNKFRIAELLPGRVARGKPLRGFDPDQVSGKIYHLRRALGQPDPGDGPIVESDAVYSFAGARDLVDALRFERLIEESPSTRVARVEELRGFSHDDLAALTEADALWSSNPATPLTVRPTVEEYWPREQESRYADLKDRLARGLIFAQIRSGTREGLIEASQLIRARLKAVDDDLYLWELLLRVDGTLGTASMLERDKAAAVRVFARQAQNQERIGAVYRSVRDGTGELIFALERPHLAVSRDGAASADDAEGDNIAAARALEPDQEAVLDVAARLGIKSESALRLDTSELRPLDCIRRVRSELAFSGNFASKWVTEPAIRSEFSRKLERLDDEGGNCRFLILDPKSDARQRLTTLREGNLSSETVPRLVELSEKHRSLEVRGFDSLPVFRIVIIDNEVVSFSPYLHNGDQYAQTDRGWAAPHVLLDPLAMWPLADAFRLYFEELWRTARPMTVRTDG